MIGLSLDAVLEVAPTAAEPYRAMLAAPEVLEPYGLLENGRRLAHFLAQALHETGGLRVLSENLNYRAERLQQVWPSRFPTLASAQAYAHKPRSLANKVYGGRLGNLRPDDGYRFRGRGLLQLTGRASYASVGRALGLDLVAFPDLVVHPDHGLRVAGEVWRACHGNTFADADDLEGVTRAINGGLIGLASRQAWLAKAWAAVELL